MWKRLVPAACVALLAAGCAHPGTASEASADGRQDLAGSLAGLDGGDYTFTRTGARPAQGTIHIPDGFEIDQDGMPSVRRIGDAFYLRYAIYGEARAGYTKIFDEAAAKATPAQAKELAAAREVMSQLDGKQWVRADEKKLKDAAAKDDLSGMENLPPAPTAAAPDVTGARALAGAVTAANRTGDTITGTLDATAKDPALQDLIGDAYYFYGPRAQAMAFQATLDNQGRLTTLTVELPGTLQAAASAPPDQIPSDSPTEPAAEPIVITISAYGQTPVPTAPANAKDLAPEAYEQLERDTD